MDRNLIHDSGVHQPDESLAEEDPNITIRDMMTIAWVGGSAVRISVRPKLSSVV